MMFANLQPRDGTTWANFTTAKDAGGDFGSGDGPDSSAEVGRIFADAVTIRKCPAGHYILVRLGHGIADLDWASYSQELQKFFSIHKALPVSLLTNDDTRDTHAQLTVLLDALKEVPNLNLLWKEPTEEAVSALAALRNLQQLQLENNRIEQTDAMCFPLSDLTNLVSLSLIGEPLHPLPWADRIGYKGMKALARLPNLRQLMLARKRWIPDDDLHYFSESPLQSLSLACTVPSQKGITAISNIAGLRHLDLSRCHTAGLDFSKFCNLKKLIELDLRGETRWSYHDAKPPTDHLAAILEIPNLQTLVLNGMALSTDLDLVRKGLERGKLPHLKTLTIGGTEYPRDKLVSP